MGELLCDHYLNNETWFDGMADNLYVVGQVAGHFASTALTTTVNTVATLVPNQTSLITIESKSNNYEVDSLKFQNVFDAQIGNICESIFNKQRCQQHHYNDMSNFLINCIEFSENILRLINNLNTLISEDCNYFLNESLNKNIISYFEAFRSNCESVNFFHENQINANILNDLFNILNNYLSKENYLENDFNNTEFIYSNVQLTWTEMKINLKNYQKIKEKEYQNIMFPKRKKIDGNNPLKFITDFFYPPPIETAIIVRQEPKVPLIKNRIVWKGNEINLNNRIENNVNVNNNRIRNNVNVNHNRLITSY